MKIQEGFLMPQIIDYNKETIYSTDCKCPNCESKNTVYDDVWNDGSYICLDCDEEDLYYTYEGECYRWNGAED
tara:strand:+ start:276 stop:494 length:219 start_codon:yes stop_codon:yes gene_type:complete